MLTLTATGAVPDPHRGTKGTCLGPRASGGPARPLESFLCSIEVLKRKRKGNGGGGQIRKKKREGKVGKKIGRKQ